MDEPLRLAGPPHAVVHLSVPEYLFAATHPGCQVRNIGEGRPWPLRDRGDLLGYLIPGDARRVAELTEDKLCGSLVVLDDLPLDVLVDARLSRRHEAGPHVDRAGSERKGRDQSGAVREATRGDDRNA